MRSVAFAQRPTTSMPASTSRRARPSRRRVESSATTTRTALGGGDGGGGDRLVPVRIDREVLLEVRQLQQAADRPLRGDDEQALPRRGELVRRADDDTQRRRVDERRA